MGIYYSRKLPDKLFPKPLSAVFNRMVERLHELQLCLPRDFHSDEVLESRLLNACTRVEAYRLSRQKVSLTVMGVIADLQTSIGTHIDVSDTERFKPLALVTDRRRHQNPSTPPWCGRRFQDTPRKSIVWGRSGCWSTNHPKDKRLEALQRNKTFRAFITDLLDDSKEEHTKEPNTSGNAEELDPLDHLEELVVHITDPGQNLSDDSDKLPLAFLISVCNEPPRALYLALRDASTAYTILYTVSQPTNYRYPSEDFLGIAIDTCCAHASTCGEKQYEAYCAYTGRQMNID